MPEIGCHSVIERPDSVSRTAPPTTTIRKTSAATLHSQTRTAPPASLRGSAGAAESSGGKWRIGDCHAFSGSAAIDRAAGARHKAPARPQQCAPCRSLDPDAKTYPQIDRRRPDGRLRSRLCARRHGFRAGAAGGRGPCPRADADLCRPRPRLDPAAAAPDQMDGAARPRRGLIRH